MRPERRGLPSVAERNTRWPSGTSSTSRPTCRTTGSSLLGSRSRTSSSKSRRHANGTVDSERTCRCAGVWDGASRHARHRCSHWRAEGDSSGSEGRSPGAHVRGRSVLAEAAAQSLGPRKPRRNSRRWAGPHLDSQSRLEDAGPQIHIVRRDTLEELTAFGDGGRQPGMFYGVHVIATDSKGNLYTAETYEGHRVQRFIYKGLGPVTSKYQGVLWPSSSR